MLTSAVFNPKFINIKIIKVIKSIAIRNGKIVWKHGPYCGYFLLELEISGVGVQNRHQDSEKW